MSKVYINSISFSLGDQVNTIESSSEAGRIFSNPSALRDAGFRQHYVCSNEMTPYDLAHGAVSQLSKDLNDVGVIIYSSCVPLNGNIGNVDQFEKTRDVKYLMDFPASHLQANFKMDKAFVVGLNQQACAGMLGSLHLAKMFLLCEPDISQVLCVTADRFPEGALYEQAYNLISDGAAAAIVSRKPKGFRLLANHAITNGALAFASDDETAGNYFSYSHKIIQETLQKAHLGISDIHWIVPQNTNLKAVQILARLLKFDPERFYFPSIQEIGHMISGDNFVNMKRLEDENRVQSGERVLLYMAGYGLNWHCAILEKE